MLLQVPVSITSHRPITTSKFVQKLPALKLHPPPTTAHTPTPPKVNLITAAVTGRAEDGPRTAAAAAAEHGGVP